MQTAIPLLPTSSPASRSHRLAGSRALLGAAPLFGTSIPALAAGRPSPILVRSVQPDHPAVIRPSTVVPRPTEHERTERTSANDVDRFAPAKHFTVTPTSKELEPLSREEEHALAIAYAEHGDERAADRLVKAHLRLVGKIAGEYHRSRAHIDDLIQEGNLGLFMAVRKFDPHRGVKLSTYAGWWIRAYMLKFILDDSRLVRLGTTQAQRKLFFGLRKEQRKLSAQGVEPTAALIASRLEVQEEEVVEMDRRLGQSEISLDAPAQRSDGESNGVSRVDRLEASSDSRPDALTEQGELLGMLRTALDKFRTNLGARDKHILRRRILSDTPETLEEIGHHYGISRERARQLESRLSQRLRQFLTAELDGPSAMAVA